MKRAGHYGWRRWLALPLLLAVLSAQAAEWAFEPSASLREEYNDNIRLTPLPHNSVWGTTFSPSVKFAHRTEVSDTSGGLRLDMSRFSGDSGLNRVDQYYSLSSKYKTERDLFGLDASYTRDSTLVTEAQTTGIVLTQAQRGNVTLNPSWTRSLTERNALRLELVYGDTRYGSAPASARLVDYSYWTAAGTWLYQFSERDQLSLSVYDSRFKTGDGTVKSDTVGVQGGLTHNFSETLQGALLVGVRSTKSSVMGLQAVACTPTSSLFTYDCGVLPGVSPPPNCVVSGGHLYCLFSSQILVPRSLDSTEHGTTLNAKLDKKFETGTLSGTLSRELVPSGSGTLVETDRLGFGASKQFSEKWSMAVEGSLQKSRYVGGGVVGNEVRYYTISPHVNWRMSEWWLLEGGYRYTEQAYKGSGAVVPASNMVYVMVSYTWPKMAVAR